MKDRTKWEYAHAMIGLMEHKSIQKVTVREICKVCDARPQNFYYHFRDKYDLVNWIYAQDVEAVCQANMNKPWSQVLPICYTNLLKRQAFYKNAFEDDSTNFLIRYIVEYQVKLYSDLLRRKGVQLDESLSFAMKYHAYACAMLTRDWHSSKQPMPPERFAALLMDAMPEKLREPMERCGFAENDEKEG